MDRPHAVYPTCVFKVNLSCCKACGVNLKKLLFKIDGVHEVDIDADKRLVKVTGKADPAIILDKIQKKKKAEILSYENPTVNTQKDDSKNKKSKKNGNNLKGKERDCFCPDEPDPHEREDYVPTREFQDDVCRDPYCRLHHKKPIIHGNNYVPRVRVQQPPLRRFPPLPPPPLVPHYPPVPHNPRYYREDLPVECDHGCSQKPPLPSRYGYRVDRHGYGGY
ncbi:heavy metal-associated isoprenylated plant protein 42-like [Actinidia eriantha]|uniref:heavy metal-associated isoprenylated plant protein 42-like n=1 Tax=Actinidia eriantha TaxID=165200 RepID=UPI00258E1857|nr:heavy metal-associated isoprenylated plant protein 42-like [Actinidia eriantha]